jgi:hypothetical protein
MDDIGTAPAWRGFLECMAWAGAGVLWTMSGGIARLQLIGEANAATNRPGGLKSMQISDSHTGFNKAPNMDTAGTLREAIALVGGEKAGASLMIHTGDVSQ